MAQIFDSASEVGMTTAARPSSAKQMATANDSPHTTVRFTHVLPLILAQPLLPLVSLTHAPAPSYSGAPVPG